MSTKYLQVLRLRVCMRVTSDIIGHEKKTMIYGLSSDGNSLDIMKAHRVSNLPILMVRFGHKSRPSIVGKIHFRWAISRNNIYPRSVIIRQ